MKLFVLGEETKETVLGTLETLISAYPNLTLVGSASAPCMDFVVPWAENRKIPIDLFLPLGNTLEEELALNYSILSISRPSVALVYYEDEEVMDHLIETVQEEGSSVREIIWKE